jgi:UDP-GlcNAc:undecaprenyl-phosphate/decaprenyl-phosphate GlcNAc-1-phosphate transferase
LVCWAHRAGFQSVILLLPILIIPFTIGLLDDLITLKPIAKIIAQTITASLIFFTINVRVTSFYELGGGEHFSVVFSYAATLLTVIVITNSLNLIDGIDGLAGVLSLISILVFGIWFFFTENYPFAMVCFALGGGILAFLFQNWEPSKIFMGDTGSLVIGTLLSIVTIQFMNDNYELPSQNGSKFSSSIGSAMAIIIIPLVDTARIIIIRLSRKLSPFKADKRHIHHALLRIGLSHRQVVYILTLVHVSFISLALLLINSRQDYVLLAIFALATTLCFVLHRIVRNSYSRADRLKSQSVSTFED